MSVPQFLLPLSLGRLTAAQLAPAVGGGPTSNRLAGFVVQVQTASNWCWAAVSVSIGTFYGSSGLSQCAVASAELSQNCCTAPMPGLCNIPWCLDRALARVGHFSRYVGTFIPFAEIQSEINASRPLGCRVAWSSGLAHFVALGGWLVASDGLEFVDAFDPFYGQSTLTHTSLISNYRNPGDAWTHTYFTDRSVAVAALGGFVPDPDAPLSV